MFLTDFTSTIEWLIESITFPIGLFKTSIKKNDKISDPKPKRQKPKNRGLPIVLFLALIGFGAIFKYYTHEHSHEVPANLLLEQKKLNDIQCQTVMNLFELEIRQYCSKHNKMGFSDFNQNDIQYLRVSFWSILLKTRKDFSQLSLGQDINALIQKVYKRERFDRDFDLFIGNLTNGNIEYLIKEMKTFVARVQLETSNDVFND